MATYGDIYREFHEPRPASYEDWLAQVDAYCARYAESNLDLADCTRDWYEDGISPSRAARMAITHQMY